MTDPLPKQLDGPKAQWKMTGRPPESKKPVKKPKIIQVLTDKDGLLAGVLYDNGRVFLWNWKKRPNQFDKNPLGEGYWGELTYPNL
jgi:hypothetical protein